MPRRALTAAPAETAALAAVVVAATAGTEVTVVASLLLEKRERL
jgi:hypothetical protein